MPRWIGTLVLVLLPATLAAAEPVTLMAERTLLPDGTLAGGLAVVVGADGTIERVVAADTAGLPAAVRFAAGSVLAPGLHELFGRLGAPGETADNTRAIDPGARAARAIDPRREDLERARRGGVLAATVAPAPVNPVAGRAVTFATGGRDELAILGEGPLTLAVGVSALDALREPTSRAGLKNWLGRWLAGADDAVLGEATVFCDESVDVRVALELFAGRPAPSFVLGAESARVARWLGPLKATAVVGPYDESTPAPALAGAGALTRAGVTVAFRGAMPAGDERSLRLTAALAVQAGMDAAAARRAMTAVPARIAGVAAHVGRVEAGRRADLVVFSGDPLDLRSEVLAIYQEGSPRPAAPGAVPTMEDPQ